MQRDENGNALLVVDFTRLEKFRHYFRMDVGFSFNFKLSSDRYIIVIGEVLNAWNVVNVADYTWVQTTSAIQATRIPQVFSRRFFNLGVEVNL